MIALYLIAAHMVGDFVLQTRWQATGKFGFSSAVAFDYRTKHVTTYSLPFFPIAIYYSHDWMHALAFMGLLWWLHFVTDTWRITSTLGDHIAWKLTDDAAKRELLSRFDPATRITFVPADNHPLRLPRNTWPALPLAIDQTLHVCQLALLGGVFLHG